MKEKIDINDLLSRVENKDLIKRYTMLIISLIIYAVAYNMFFVNTGLILGGSGGIAILLKNYIIKTGKKDDELLFTWIIYYKSNTKHDIYG